ncbi:methionyl-tRNA formyltransferase [Rhabdobacter roseus]|uniref:Methionyl-tRNA formyltransferase n=1 Tax=Rhabdobacter roseus TaxID=1655419 RepID=A0A840TRR0_9BACT|nr:methionyl-tRNA formyltransferase [Rhabdobacter roseus]MBB5285994.1 methionyl-tRNA formyltransferase [Rhabdobacter roseus]
MSERLRIIFMGTPDFAVPSLRILVENGCEVVAVITAPDRPSGRGLKLTPSPVKQYALERGILVLQPEKLKESTFLEQLRQLRADLQVVVAFRMLPEVVWSMPGRGTFNLHASLLPQYRGAAPINWAVINGETQTGVTTFFIEKEIDTGKIIFQEKEAIHPDDTAGTLYERLMQKGAELVLRTVRAIEAGNYPQVPQPEVPEPRLAPKIYKDTCAINWELPREQVRNLVRGLAPYPAAWTNLGELFCKIYRVSSLPQPPDDNLAPGTYRTDNKTYLHLRAADGWVAVEELQLEGKRRMTTDELLRGLKL